MSTITIKNLPQDIHRELKLKASLHHRSLNNEIINSLEKVLGWEKVNKDDLLMEAGRMRARFALGIKDKDINNFKESGRS